MERAARPVRRAPDQPRASLLGQRSLHELGGRVLLPHAPGRNRASSPYRWRLPASVRAGVGLEGRPQAGAERLTRACDRRAGDEVPSEHRLVRLLAAGEDALVSQSYRLLDSPISLPILISGEGGEP